MSLTVEQFTERLASSGLLPDEQLRESCAALPADSAARTNAEALARELVKQKKLTKFQAEQIYAGKGSSLTLGNYVILDKLGQGGMGMVLKAEHKRMKRLVALKVMSPAAVKTPDALKRFHREVEAAAKLTHPNIVNAFDADEAKGTHFLVMEYVEGTDLSVLVKKHGPLPADQAVRCIIQAARGLEFAHEQGVIHRDIKPANLLLSWDKGLGARGEGLGARGEGVDKTFDPRPSSLAPRSFTIKILDMGLARIEGAIGGSSEGAGLTQSGTIMGTVDYMSPEQAMDTKHADARSDIYSLGCSLYYLLVGKCLYDGDTMMKKLMAHQNAPIPELSGEWGARSAEQGHGEMPSTPHSPLPTLNSVFKRMVAKKPEDRPQSMTAVIAELERCLSGGSPTVSFERNADSATTSSNSGNELQDFLMQISGGGSGQTLVGSTQSAISPSSVDAETMISSASEGGTDPRADLSRTIEYSGPRGVAKKSRTVILVSIVAAVMVLLGIVFATRNKPGKVPPEIADDEVTATDDKAGRKRKEKVVADRSGDRKVSADSKLDTKEVAVPPPSVITNPPVSTTAAVRWPFDPNDGNEYVWGTPENLGTNINGSHYDEHPELSPDGLKLWFSGGGNVWVSKRQSLDAPWEQRFDAGGQFNDHAGWDSEPTMSADWLTLVFCSDRGNDKKDQDLWMSTRSKFSDPFGPVVKLGGDVNSPEWDNCPALSADGLTLIFTSGRAGGIGDLDLWQATRANSTAEFGDVKNLGPTINSPVRDSAAHLSSDGLMLLFESSRQGRKTDLYFSTRLTRDAAFGTPVSLGSVINTKHDEQGPCLSRDGQTLMFYSNRPGGLGAADIWMSRRIRKNTATKEASVPTSNIPAEALSFDGHRYLLVESFGTWNEAKAGAEKLGGHLVTINTRAERDWILENMWRKRPMKEDVGCRMFLGGFNTDGKWKWITDEPFDQSLYLGTVNNSSDHGLTWISDTGWGIAIPGDLNSRYFYYVVEWDSDDQAVGAAQKKAPPLAVAPFGAQQARAHQEAWAKHLGVPVEFANSLGMKFRLIPPGEFSMGTDEKEIEATAPLIEAGAKRAFFLDTMTDATPRHTVQITRPFYMQTHEVTNGVYEKLLGKLPGPEDLRTKLSPEFTSPESSLLNFVTLAEATACCNALSQKEEKTPAYQIVEGKRRRNLEANGYRLPTEAEWEYACRAGTTTWWFFGEKADPATLWEYQTRNSSDLPKANPFGLFDMYGGSSEWCYDRRGRYGPDSVVDPFTEPGDTPGVARGGSHFAGLGTDLISINSVARHPLRPHGVDGYYGLGRMILPIEVK